MIYNMWINIEPALLSGGWRLSKIISMNFISKHLNRGIYEMLVSMIHIKYLFRRINFFIPFFPISYTLCSTPYRDLSYGHMLNVLHIKFWKTHLKSIWWEHFSAVTKILDYVFSSCHNQSYFCIPTCNINVTNP